MKIIIKEQQLNTILQTINEDFVGKMISSTAGKMNRYDVYKNPQSINKMEPQLRGIVDRDGNLYVVDDGLNVVHFELLEYLSKKNLIGYYDIHISVQRYGETNDFYLSESYDYMGDSFHEEETGTSNETESMKIIKTILGKASKVNPQYNFFIDSITSQPIVDTYSTYE